MAYGYLLIAILAEVIATTALKASNGFTVVIPSIVVVVGYAISFYLLTLALKTLPLGMTYATWSGMGIVLVSLLGISVFGERLNVPMVLGMALIIAGIVIMHVFATDR